MSRLIACDLCGAQRPAADIAGWDSWYGLDVCPPCLAGSRPVGELLALIRKATGDNGAYVSAADIIPERTRPRATPRIT